MMSNSLSWTTRSTLQYFKATVLNVSTSHRSTAKEPHGAAAEDVATNACATSSCAAAEDVELLEAAACAELLEAAACADLLEAPAACLSR